MRDHQDDGDREGAGDDDLDAEDAIALDAVNAWLEAEGDDDLAIAQREALAAIAEAALAQKERRVARERQLAERQRRRDREQADARAEAARREAADRAWRTQQRAAKETCTNAMTVRSNRPLRDEERDATRHRAHPPVRPANVVAPPKRPSRDVAEAPRVAAIALPPPKARRKLPAAIAPGATRSSGSPSLVGQPASVEVAPIPTSVTATSAAATNEAVHRADSGLAFEGAQDGLPTVAPAEPSFADLDASASGEVLNPRDGPARVPSDDDLAPLSGADLVKWRSRLQITQQEAADRLGARQGTISKAESRAHALLGPSLRRALAAALRAGRTE